MLISETRYTNSRQHLSIPNYKVHLTNHPSGKAHGGTAVIIKSSIKHHELPKHKQDYLQATSIAVESASGALTVSATYCPPKHVITKDQFIAFFSELGPRFIAGGDWNAKNKHWGSRLTLPRGRRLYDAMEECKLDSLSTGKPTYWPTDPMKIPDLLDFFCKERHLTKLSTHRTYSRSLIGSHPNNND